MGLHPCKASDASSWINAAILRNAEIIEVDVKLNGLPCPVPNDLFMSQVLVDLRLCSGFVVDVTGPVSLPILKTIDISCCKFSNGDSTKRLFSSCWVLEDMRLWCCDSCDGNVISISALSLRHLTIHCWSDGCEWELNNVPNLDFLCFCWSVNILKSLRNSWLTNSRKFSLYLFRVTRWRLGFRITMKNFWRLTFCCLHADPCVFLGPLRKFTFAC